uniref:Uncharacterized protein n=1 Tax=Sphaerodactylus townsendi TaxID=933632 RepID=A0ACB8FD12_9SAUR
MAHAYPLQTICIILYLTGMFSPFQDDWDKIQKPTSTYVSAVDSDNSSWSSWVIPVLAASFAVFVYRFYFSE